MRALASSSRATASSIHCELPRMSWRRRNASVPESTKSSCWNLVGRISSQSFRGIATPYHAKGLFRARMGRSFSMKSRANSMNFSLSPPCAAYISAALHRPRYTMSGLVIIPPIPAPAREEARRLLAEEGPAALHARLAAEDPASAARLRPSDSQRIARAFEVWRGTGRGIAAWQAEASAAPAPCRFAAILLDPPREKLRDAIAKRWAGMMAEGAAEEVQALLAQGLDPALPAMRALGVPEIAGLLARRMTAEEASARAILATGQYTKRQATWFRHHELAPPERSYIINARFEGLAQFSESESANFFAFLDFIR
ncbi:MAG: hypothetical protein EBU14_14485 [Acetobacteraceae bacterium]|nr:hypothetical protein [Acetobacteraceae bacterium]